MKQLRQFLAVLALAAACLPAASQNDWQSRKDRENAATSAASITRNGGKWDAKAEAERREDARRRGAATPPIITHCDPGFCYDDKGGTYHKVGPDTMTGPNGRPCHRAGNTWNCH